MDSYYAVGRSCVADEHLEREIDRLGLRSATVRGDESDIVALEERLGCALPEDYRWFLLNHAAGVLDNFLVVAVLKPARHERPADFDQPTFYNATPAREILDEQAVGDFWDLPLLDPGAEPSWSSLLVPIHPFNHNSLYALDLRHSRTDPPVILVNYDDVEPDVYAPPLTLRWARYVAPSFTAMLGLAKISSGERFEFEEYPIDITTYREQLIDWEDGFINYLSNWHEVARRLH